MLTALRLGQRDLKPPAVWGTHDNLWFSVSEAKWAHSHSQHATPLPVASRKEAEARCVTPSEAGLRDDGKQLQCTENILKK